MSPRAGRPGLPPGPVPVTGPHRAGLADAPASDGAGRCHLGAGVVQLPRKPCRFLGRQVSQQAVQVTGRLAQREKPEQFRGQRDDGGDRDQRGRRNSQAGHVMPGAHQGDRRGDGGTCGTALPLRAMAGNACVRAFATGGVTAGAGARAVSLVGHDSSSGLGPFRGLGREDCGFPGFRRNFFQRPWRTAPEAEA